MAESIIALDIVRVFLNRANYTQFKDLLNMDVLDRQTYEILSALETYYKRDTVSEEIDVDLFSTWFTHFFKLSYATGERELYNIIFSNIKSRRAAGISCEAIIKELNLRAARQQIMSAVHEGKEAEDIEKILGKLRSNSANEVEYLADGIDSIIDNTKSEDGLTWRLDCLNHAIGSLTKSTFLVLAGSVDSGKTSLTISEVTHMATQLKDDEVILWFVTENTTAEAKKRAYCAMLSRPWGDFEKAIKEGKREAINKAYLKKQGGKDRIKFCQASGMRITDVEKEIAKRNPRLVVMDLLDDLIVPKNRLVSDISTANTTALYKWALDCACLYCPIIATSQLSNIVSTDPDHYRYPWMNALSGSRVEKQGKATVLLYIGRYERDDRRYLSTPKNKKKAGMSTWRACVSFDQECSLFKPLR